METIHNVRLKPVLLAPLRDRQTAHSAVMAALPKGLGASPRANAACLWHLDEQAQTLRVQTGMKFEASWFGTPVTQVETPQVSLGDQLQIQVAIACQFTPPSDVPEELRAILQRGANYRSRLQVVPLERRIDWFCGRLQARGFEPNEGSVHVSDLRRATLGRRGGSIPFVDASCQGVVTDADSFNQAIRTGLGKGKNFGLGLLRITPMTDTARRDNR